MRAHWTLTLVRIWGMSQAQWEEILPPCHWHGNEELWPWAGSTQVCPGSWGEANSWISGQPGTSGEARLTLTWRADSVPKLLREPVILSIGLFMALPHTSCSSQTRGRQMQQCLFPLPKAVGHTRLVDSGNKVPISSFSTPTHIGTVEWTHQIKEPPRTSLLCTASAGLLLDLSPYQAHSAQLT